MPGQSYFDFLAPSPPLGGFATPMATFLFDPSYGLQLLPNVLVHQIRWADGAEIPTARFSYILDDRTANSAFPNQFEQLWPLNMPYGNTTGQYVVLPNDRLVVMATFAGGITRLMFDGFARMPQADLGPDHQFVTFSAVGVAFRCYDIPVAGRVQRNGATSQVTATDGSQDVATNLPTRFNPATNNEPTGQPNCTPVGYDTGQGDPSTSHPVFLDPAIDRTNDPTHSPTLWTLSGAVEYLLATYNPPTPPVEEGDDPPEGSYVQLVKNPDFTDLDNLLDNRKPVSGSDFFDPSDPSTYTSSPVIVRDFDATNMAWPDALERLLGYHGFGMRWVLGIDGSGNPLNTFEVYRKDASNPDTAKVVYLPPSGTPINPGLVNVESMTAAFDYHGVANSFVVETHPNRYEISVVLAPLFKVASADAQSPNRKKFLKSALAGATEDVRRAYRWYGVDELGDGHTTFDQDDLPTWVTGTSFDFSEVFPPETDSSTGEDTPTFCYRLRPGLATCLSDDGNGDRIKAELALSRDYGGDAPAIWDGTGTWQPIEGDWKLLEDRLGIEFTADDPEAIHVGKSNLKAQTQNPGSVLKGIRSIANPPDEFSKSSSLFWLRLTTVIESDETIEGKATRRPASPLQNEVRRRIDAKDHFRRDTIHTSSANYNQQQLDHGDWPSDDNGNLLPRDDTDAANNYAAQLRTAHEFPTVPIGIPIPGITLAYQPGDRISYIAGRNVSLQTNAGTEQTESPAYPFVVAVTWTMDGDNQSTTLQCSDRRMEPQPLEHRRARTKR